MRRFGDILVEEGLIEEDELKKALTLQRKSAYKLGQILIKKGLISEEDALKALSKQYEMEFAEKLEPKNIEQLTDKVPLKFVQKYRVVPYFIEDREIRIAMTDPSILHPLDEFRLLFLGYDVKPVLTRESEILRVIHNVYEAKSRAEDTDLGMSDGLELLDDIQDLHDSTELANQAPIIKLVNMILSNAVNEKASDIHFEPQEKDFIIRFRIDGILHKMMAPPKSVQNGVISRVKIMANLNIAENRLPQDGRIRLRFSGNDIDIRVSSLPTQHGERLVLRLLNRTASKYELASIGFEKDTYDLFVETINQPNGIVLITGPTGSGKTTTLYAALTRLNSSERNIITVEDPIEYQIDGIGQVQARPKIGFTFAEGLRSILRQDPDVIMVGEIRDEETARIAIQSSLTGHLVFSTLHTNDAPSAVTRLIDMGIEPFLVTSTCRGIMAQRLVRRLCTHCKKPKTVNVKDLTSLGLSYISNKKKATAPTGKVKIFEPNGCKECMNTGYRGRMGVYEFMPLTAKLRELVLARVSLDELKDEAIREGMVTLRNAALRQVILGITSLDEAMRIT
ncbi:type II secretion system ATPase GspE [Turneriella parva]|uniref:protein-secreting ATPase n=1 Tax=Turneriella parva (strain ATCC BAA-1111 / DSM 21527 / NCTC 11395 / H) TaxID=869212 RepID=I4BBU8_TURPD|nr:type II secretion system ATPase GspE [Turneriella parva]AFM14755.1 type II secretion system protein E (GspE) [Turneriella parva DSM 21527]